MHFSVCNLLLQSSATIYMDSTTSVLLCTNCMPVPCSEASAHSYGSNHRPEYVCVILCTVCRLSRLSLLDNQWRGSITPVHFMYDAWATNKITYVLTLQHHLLLILWFVENRILGTSHRLQVWSKYSVALSSIPVNTTCTIKWCNVKYICTIRSYVLQSCQRQGAAPNSFVRGKTPWWRIQPNRPQGLAVAADHVAAVCCKWAHNLHNLQPARSMQGIQL